MEPESPVVAFNDPFVSVCLQSHFFFTFCSLSEGVIQKTAPVSTMDAAQVKNLLTSTLKKREQEPRKEQDVNDEGKHSPEGSNITKPTF